jgi:pimeloyl-ACP methyl ester carboxylesterase
MIKLITNAYKPVLQILFLLSILTSKVYSQRSYPAKERFITAEDSLKLWVMTYGNPTGKACIFINGAGANSSFWPESLRDTLVKKGIFVILYDHRDFGYSDKLNFDKHPYNVMDLTKDAITILDSLHVNKAHVVGHSMGGFIAQLLAIHYPERVISFTSISSSTNSPNIPLPPDKTWQIFMENNPTGDLKNDLKGFLPVWKYLNGTAQFDEELAIEYTRNLYSRQEIKGALGESHVNAQANLKDRSEQLKKVKVPALVIHGEEDYLVDKYGGIQTAECIENSKLVLIPEMGHIPFNNKILERFENEIIQFITRSK